MHMQHAMKRDMQTSYREKRLS